MTPTEERLARLLGMSVGPIYAIDVDRVNIDDLINAEPGRIVRCFGPPRESVMLLETVGMPTDCVAGWISEEV